ncbi:SRPBCC family protein [Nocardioides perillae]|uniref:Uncharacterized protein YndB with AHSA1/START domain n=1 Tax=Nocardioides perillae TaxID=1119534 RepID=A0A7Y9RSI9_9ACTN|nr:uncharacterized protein YndB with AHSA1/START domain [Nocardioides perillae]
MSQTAPEPMTLSESVHVAAPPEAVWALVTDVGRTGEWSSVCTACEWDDPAVVADGPVVGATFTGHNTSGERSWDTTCTVTAADAPREFRWEVNGGLVRWGYVLTPEGDGTTLREDWEFTTAGQEFFHDKYAEHAPRVIAQRAEEARTGVPETLATLKRLAEASVAAP